jgi:hypothetical protein
MICVKQYAPLGLIYLRSVSSIWNHIQQLLSYLKNHEDHFTHEFKLLPYQISEAKPRKSRRKMINMFKEESLPELDIVRHTVADVFYTDLTNKPNTNNVDQ